MAKKSHKTGKKSVSGRQGKKTSVKTKGQIKLSTRLKPKEDFLFGFQTEPWTSLIKISSARLARSGVRGTVLVVSELNVQRVLSQCKSRLGSALPKWKEPDIKKWIENSERETVFSFSIPDGPVWLIHIAEKVQEASLNSPFKIGPDPLEESGFSRIRDAAGLVFSMAQSAKLGKIVLDFTEASRTELQAFIVGLEIAHYSYAEQRGYKSDGYALGDLKPKVLLLPPTSLSDSTEQKEALVEAGRLGVAVNLARHLVNLPGGTLTPTVYSELVAKLFHRVSNVRLEVWDERRLKAEKMNLLLAVGGGAAFPPRLVRISYRPQNLGAEKRPIALVGKGITFDSGGLDLKPSSGMRLMKKDMGGSAAVLALTWWAAQSNLPLALDSYLAMAENAVSSTSFRPGDILTAKNGMAIEIDNTDAEGRLVLADAISVAVNQKGSDQPACLIDFATLTGAIKVGLGVEVGGLFTNSDELAREIFDAGLRRGDLVWRMPLYQPYRRGLSSKFADYVNSASGGWGGAITAALFLELFLKNSDGKTLPWAHLDIYAWKDGASGAWTEGGGSGQGVLAVAEVLGRLVQGNWAEE